jgi:hypothetical protein
VHHHIIIITIADVAFLSLRLKQPFLAGDSQRQCAVYTAVFGIRFCVCVCQRRRCPPFLPLAFFFFGGGLKEKKDEYQM